MGMCKERSALMSFAELIPAMRALPRSEKFRLVRLLLDDLAGEELFAGLKQGQEFPRYSPEFAPRCGRPTRHRPSLEIHAGA